MNKITTKLIRDKLSEVLDPELGISIVDLGLVYKIYFKGPDAHIVMTLTTIGCPLFETIELELRNKLKELKLADNNIKIDLTFNPPWTIERMSQRGKAMLGI